MGCWIVPTMTKINRNRNNSFNMWVRDSCHAPAATNTIKFTTTCWALGARSVLRWFSLNLYHKAILYLRQQLVLACSMESSRMHQLQSKWVRLSNTLSSIKTFSSSSPSALPVCWPSLLLPFLVLGSAMLLLRHQRHTMTGVLGQQQAFWPRVMALWGRTEDFRVYLGMILCKHSINWILGILFSWCRVMLCGFIVCVELDDSRTVLSYLILWSSSTV